jgi:hypothetical protein
VALILPLLVAVSLFVSVFVALIGPIPVRATSVSLNYPIKVKGADPLWRIKRKGLWGFMDRAGQEVIKPRFTQVSDFVGGLASACVPTPAPARSRKSQDENVRCGYINHAGEFVIPPRFRGGNHFQDGVAVVQMNDGATLIDTQGEILTTNRFFYVEEFSEGLAGVRIARNGDNASEDAQNDLLAGYIDTSGRVVIAPIYEYGEPFQEGLAAVSIEAGHWGFIDATGRVVIDFRYFDVKPFSGGVATVRDPISSKWSVIDVTGRTVRPFELAEAEGFHEGLAGAKDYVKGAGLIGRDGQFRFQRPDLHEVETPREGLAKFTIYTEKHEMWSGFLDLSGNVRVPAKYWFAESFSEGRAAVSGKGTDSWGYVDTSGALVIPQRFGSAQEFVDGLALVFLEDAWCYIDLQGRVVARDIWDSH